MARQKYFTPAELSLHNTEDDLWVSLHGKVLDLTPLFQKYEGDPMLFPLLGFGGKDVSHFFDPHTKAVRLHVDPENHNVDTFLPFRKFPDAPSQKEAEQMYCSRKEEEVKKANDITERVNAQMLSILKRESCPAVDNTSSTGSEGSNLGQLEDSGKSPAHHTNSAAKESGSADKPDANAQQGTVNSPGFATPWWKDEQYIIGLLSQETRLVRIMNTLIQKAVTVEVCSEETLEDILERYLRFNVHARSYTWKYFGSTLDMKGTLDTNGIPARSQLMERLKLNNEDFVPTLLLYFNDDLTEM